MKLIQATVEEAIRIPTIHNGGSHLFVGMVCSAAWGGGKIASLEYDEGKNSLAIRKDCRFKNPSKNEDYDVELVPWSRVIRASGVDDAPAIAGPVATEETAEAAQLPSCSKCGQPSGGKPLCQKCYEAEKKSQAKGK